MTRQEYKPWENTGQGKLVMRNQARKIAKKVEQARKQRLMGSLNTYLELYGRDEDYEREIARRMPAAMRDLDAYVLINGEDEVAERAANALRRYPSKAAKTRRV